MKLVVLALALLICSSTYATEKQQSECTTGDQTLHVCSARMQPRDHQIATAQFQSLAFCFNKNKGPYAVGLDLEEQTYVYGMRAAAEPKVYPLTYKFWGTDQVQFTMTVKAPRPAINSTFSVVYTKEYSVSSSFVCK